GAGRPAAHGAFRADPVLQHRAGRGHPTVDHRHDPARWRVRAAGLPGHSADHRLLQRVAVCGLVGGRGLAGVGEPAAVQDDKDAPGGRPRCQSRHQQRFEQSAAELEAALTLVKKAAAGAALTTDQGRGLVDVIARYTHTFLWLQRYDEGLLAEPTGSPGGVLPSPDEAHAGIARLKADLMARREATHLFGNERDDHFIAILGNLDQTVFGEPAYPTIEAKAAHLLYFVIKNHPFSDGNKRIGSYLFVDFLARNGRLLRHNEPVINDVGLAALALLVAESDPKAKEVMIRLIENMLAPAQPRQQVSPNIPPGELAR